MSRNTPRLTRSRNQTPLPALPTKKSHAYGASGKASLQEQVTTSAVDFGAAFSNTRTRGSIRAPSRDPMPPPAKRPDRPRRTPASGVQEQGGDDEGEVPANDEIPPSAKRGRKPITTPAPIVQEEVDDDEIPMSDDIPTINGFEPSPNFGTGQESSQSNGDSRPGTSRTDMQNSAMYDAYPQAPQPARQQPAKKAQARPSPPHSPPPSVPLDSEYAPWSIRVFLYTVPRYFASLMRDANIGTKALYILLGMLLFAAMLWTGLYAPLPAGLQHTRDRAIYRFVLMGGVPGVDPYEHEVKWHAFTHDRIFLHMLPNRTVPRLQFAINVNFQNRIDGIENKTETIQQQLAIQEAAMSEFERVLPHVIVTTQEDGEWAIPLLFWKALVQKMSSDDAAPLWSQFMESNEKQLQSFSRRTIDSQIDDITSTHRLIKREDFQAALAQNNQMMQEYMATEMRSFRSQVLNEAKAVSKDYLEKSEVMSMARAHISALGHANLVFNTDKALHEVNYLSAGLDALVDPHYTTPTKLPTRSWIFWAMSSFRLLRQYPHPPAAALRGWEETTDCWCSDSSPKQKVKAQLGIKLGFKLHPTEFTIEHIPAKGTRDISAAPKDFELWAQVANATEATRISNAIALSTVYECRGQAPKGEKNWVCLAADAYDIHFHNFVQTFTIWPDTVGLDIATERIAVQVLENWGNTDHTCLYRVRMTGKEAGMPSD